MNITIYHSKRYDWQLHPDQDAAKIELGNALALLDDNSKNPGYDPSDVAHARIVALCIKQMHDGSFHEKVQIDCKSGADYTSVGLPEAQISSLMQAATNKGTNMTINQVVAFHLAERILPNHVHPDFITKIEVDGDPKASTFLEAYFGVTKGN
jgi:hypothetical protein